MAQTQRRKIKVAPATSLSAWTKNDEDLPVEYLHESVPVPLASFDFSGGAHPDEVAADVLAHRMPTFGARGFLPASDLPPLVFEEVPNPSPWAAGSPFEEGPMEAPLSPPLSPRMEPEELKELELGDMSFAMLALDVEDIREVRESSVDAEARARCDRLLEAQQEAAAVSKAREEAVAAAAAAVAAAAVKAETLERAIIGDGEGGSSGVASPSEASEAAEVPADFICPITAEIMTDPVSTVDGFTYEREAISKWLRTNDTSPRTGAKLESKTLIPNHLVRCVLRAFIEASSAPSTTSLQHAEVSRQALPSQHTDTITQARLMWLEAAAAL